MQEKMKHFVLLISLIAIALISCKTTEKSASTEPKSKTENLASAVKPVVVEANRKPVGELDFTVLKWSIRQDTLIAIVRYSGGCKEHDFNAYFSGAWLKSLPAQAVIELEHIDLENDPCRSMVKDTLKFDLTPVRYPDGKEIKVKWQGNSQMMDFYRYGK